MIPACASIQDNLSAEIESTTLDALGLKVEVELPLYVEITEAGIGFTITEAEKDEVFVFFAEVAFNVKSSFPPTSSGLIK